MSAAPSMLRLAPRIARHPLQASSRALAARCHSTLPTRAEHVATTIRAAPSIPLMSAKPASTSTSPSASASASAPSAASASGSASTSAGTAASPAGDKAPAPRRRQIKSKKAALKMTPEALTRLRALSSNPTEPKLLRIGVKTRGCAGMAYHLDYVDPPGGKFDEVVEQDGVRVLIDSKALFSIIGSTMDWRDNRLSAGFVFDNPNIEDTCGCGESFNIKF